MSAAQKHAWFNLIVVTLTIATVLALCPVLGIPRAFGGFGLLGLLGLGPIFYRRRGQVVSDERDDLIRRRSVILAYTLFWMVFVAAALIARPVYGDAVPTIVVVHSVWFAFMLVVLVQSIATLVQYRMGSSDAK